MNDEIFINCGYDPQLFSIEDKAEIARLAEDDEYFESKIAFLRSLARNSDTALETVKSEIVKGRKAANDFLTEAKKFGDELQSGGGFFAKELSDEDKRNIRSSFYAFTEKAEFYEDEFLASLDFLASELADISSGTGIILDCRRKLKLIEVASKISGKAYPADELLALFEVQESRKNALEAVLSETWELMQRYDEEAVKAFLSSSHKALFADSPDFSAFHKVFRSLCVKNELFNSSIIKIIECWHKAAGRSLDWA